MIQKKWTRLLLLSVAIILYGFAIFFCRSAKKDADLTYIVLSQNLGAASAQEIFAQEQLLADSVGFCFWGEAAAQRVTCRETGGMAQVTLVLLSGNPELMGAGALAWQNGCFIDEGTAQKLFGTKLCGGQTLWLDDVPYQVLGTIRTDQPTMLTAAEEKDGRLLNRCILWVPAESGRQIASQFLMRWGLQGKVIDFYPLWVMCHNLLLLLPGILLIAVFIHCAKRVRRIFSEQDVSFSLLPVLLKPMLFLLAEVCLFAFLGSRILIPEDLIPSRWSDFSFWGKWLENQKDNFRLVMLTPMGNTHLQMMLDMVKSLVSNIVSGLLALSMRRRRPNANSDDRR